MSITTLRTRQVSAAACVRDHGRLARWTESAAEEQKTVMPFGRDASQAVRQRERLESFCLRA